MIRFFIWMNTDAHRQRFLRNRRMRSVTEAKALRAMKELLKKAEFLGLIDEIEKNI